MSKSTILAFFLRGGAASSKILFLAYLGYLSKAEVAGQFAIFSTLAIVFTQLAGFEINQVIARKYHSLTIEEKFKSYLINGVISIFLYFIISIPFIYFYYELLRGYWFLGCLILILEHYSTELYRFYIININPFKASLILFIKNVGWVIFFVFLSGLGFFEINIVNILVSWAFFVFIASLVGSPSIKFLLLEFDKIELKSIFSDLFDMLLGAKIFVLIAISISGLAAVDKLILERFFDFKSIGEFYFYLTIASIPGLIVSFGVGATLWPKCIRSAAVENTEECWELWNKILKYYLVLVSSISLLLIFCLLFVGLVDNEKISSKSLEVISYLILAGAAMAMIEPYKLKIYIQKNDYALLFGAWIHLIVMCITLFFLAKNHSLKEVAIGMAFVNIFAFVFYRFYFPEKITKIIKC